MKKRCPWVPDESLYKDYHDKEWGVPVHNDRHLFEFLILQGMQAVGMVNVHIVDCYRYKEISKLNRKDRENPVEQ